MLSIDKFSIQWQKLGFTLYSIIDWSRHIRIWRQLISGYIWKTEFCVVFLNVYIQLYKCIIYLVEV